MGNGICIEFAELPPKRHTHGERERLSDYSINNIDLSAGIKRGGEHGAKLERQDSMSLK